MSSLTSTVYDFSERLKATPMKPGVYMMKDTAENILYVGKADSLRNRLRSYFANKSRLEPKTRAMVRKITDFDFIITASTSEALILENNLIKRYRPAYNARLKDDKTYPFIKIDLSEEFPLVYVTRRFVKDGSRYFGPYTNANSVRKTLSLLKKLFPYRSCTKEITGTDTRPCLDFHINRCVGPCIGAVDKNQYSEIINQVSLFLSGKSEDVTRELQQQMQNAATELRFEQAAALRDQIKAIENVNERQMVTNLSPEDLDVIAIATGKIETWIEIFFIRNGTVIGRDNLTMSSTSKEPSEQILGAFIKQFYNANMYVPAKIIVEHKPEDTNSIQDWLSAKRGGPVKIFVPQRGQKRKLVQMVSANAKQGFTQLNIKRATTKSDLEIAMKELQEALSLPSLPRRIECFDISNIHGTNPVGSMVVFENGKSKNRHYRRFKIKNHTTIDDYSMMREMLTRRFRRLARDANTIPEINSSPHSTSRTDIWNVVPNLVLIDGGKGHLSAALQVFLNLGIDFVPLASLAKKEESLFIPHSQEPIVLPRNSKSLYLVQRARDEAHRFAITFHRKRRSQKATRSVIDEVQGIGPKKRGRLLKRFGSIKGIMNATIDEIAVVPGMNKKLTIELKTHLHSNENSHSSN